MWNRTLEAVFAFRNDHATAYGILPESIEDGVLTDAGEYLDVPEFWTSTKAMLGAANTMCGASRELAQEAYDKIDDGSPRVVMQIGEENPLLIEILCRIFQERINWLSSRPGDTYQNKAEKLRFGYERMRHEQFRALSAIAQTEAGMKLA